MEDAEGNRDVESEDQPDEDGGVAVDDEARHIPKQKRKRTKAAATGSTKTKGPPPAKRPRTAEAEARGGHTSAGEEADASAAEDDEEGGKGAKAGKKGKVSEKTKTKHQPRKPKGTAVTKQPKLAGRRGRRVKEKGEGYDVEQIAKDTKIATDNTLFSTPILLLFSYFPWLTHTRSLFFFRCSY